MTETLKFPGLGLEFDLNRVAFTVGEFPIYWYGIIFALAFIAGFAFFHYNIKKVGVHPNVGFDVLFWAVIGGLVGARLYYVVFQWEALYADDPMKIFAVRDGGLAIYGGVIGAVLVGYIACRIKKIPLLPVLDVGLPALLLGQAIGRWGNFFNIEAFGSNTTLPWGMTSTGIEAYLNRPDVVAELEKLGQVVVPTMPVHPTFFYEFLWNLIGFFILAFVLLPRRKFDGQVAIEYMVWYGLGRAVIEGLRTDSLVAETPFGLIRVSQVLAFALFALGIIAIAYLGKLMKADKKPAWLSMYKDTVDSKRRVAYQNVLETGDKRKTACDICATPAGEPCDCYRAILDKDQPALDEYYLKGEGIATPEEDTKKATDGTVDEDTAELADVSESAFDDDGGDSGE